MINYFRKNWLAPKHFYHTSSQYLPWLWGLFAILLCYGIAGALWFAPSDYQQGNGFRIIYVHVPSAILAMTIYSLMAIFALMTLVWRIKLAAIMMSQSAVIGAWFTWLSLITGTLWGKPMWGTWWIWDARLTSMLILFFLYLGFIGLQSAIMNPQQQQRAGAILALVGFINIPIIHYSVYWWHTLHQGATISRLDPTIAPAMAYPLFAMIASFLLYYVIVVLIRVRSQLLQQNYPCQWVKEILTT